MNGWMVMMGLMFVGCTVSMSIEKAGHEVANRPSCVCAPEHK